MIGGRFLQHSMPWIGSYRAIFTNVSYSAVNHQAVERKLTRRVYSVDFLKSIRKIWTYFPFDLSARLQSLGILKSIRGCRSGRVVKKRMAAAKLNIHTRIHRSMASSSVSTTQQFKTSRCNILNLIHCSADMNIGSRHSSNQPTNYIASKYDDVQISSDGFQNLANKVISTRVTHRRPSLVRKFASLCNPRVLIEIQAEINCRDNKFAANCKLALWNARSIRNKSASISDFVFTNNLDVLILTETWLCGDSKDNSSVSDLCNTLLDHDFVHTPRSHRKGGGLGVLCKKGLKAQLQTNDVTFQSFEHLIVLLTSGSVRLQLVAIYRPPPSKKNNLSVGLFLEEFGSFLEQIITSPGKLLIAGDFNFHTDVSSDYNASKFLGLIDTFCLQQLVRGPTHKSGHTLDLVISRSHDDLVTDINSLFDLPSDHAALTFHLQFPKPKPTRSLVKFRKTREINVDLFQKDILASSIITNPEVDIDSLVNQYNSVLLNLFDTYAPETCRQITLRPHAPWYTDSLRAAKRIKRSLERKWRSSGLEIHKQMFKQQCKIYQDLLDVEKRNHHMNKLSTCDQRQLFKIVDKLVNGSKQKILPSIYNAESLPDLFLNYFTNKIHSLRSSLEAADADAPSVCEVVTSSPCTSYFSSFRALTLEDTHRLITKSAAKTCALDPAPSTLVKDCLKALALPITTILNKSLSSGTVPTLFKSALITPVFKKSSLDHNLLSSYRPVSNLPFLSKVLERAVLEQLNGYLRDNQLYAKLQSAYRQFHSTETALLRVHNDLLTTIDNGNEAILVLLDLTAAFDTIDHCRLLTRLRNKFGISGLALKWFEDYLYLRTQTVVIDSFKSSCSLLASGVPQGSVLGPVLFTLYLSPLEDVVTSHALNSMFYADDTQLYMTVKKSDMHASKENIERCAHDITSWCTNNTLALNDSKTEVLHLTSKFSKSPQPFPGLEIGNSHIDDSGVVRDLGLILDRHLSMDSNIKHICKASSYAIYKIGKIRQYLNKPSCEKLVHAFISSRLDCCNSLLYGLPECLLNKLQLIQNTAARLVTRVKRNDHITPVLRSLHWLPVHSRIKFKILLLTYKALHGQAPIYISELLNPLVHQRCLRSNSDGLLLSVPRTKTQSYGDRAFSAAAPKLWNELPKGIRAAETVTLFKSRLKTFLFKEHFK